MKRGLPLRLNSFANELHDAARACDEKWLLTGASKNSAIATISVALKFSVDEVIFALP
jgi:hypothetical protein